MTKVQKSTKNPFAELNTQKQSLRRVNPGGYAKLADVSCRYLKLMSIIGRVGHSKLLPPRRVTDAIAQDINLMLSPKTRHSRANVKEFMSHISQRLRTIEEGLKPFYKSVYGECSICLEDMEKCPWISLVSCSHKFHTACIKPWFKSQEGGFATCPLCRKRLPRRQVTELKS